MSTNQDAAEKKIGVAREKWPGLYGGDPAGDGVEQVEKKIGSREEQWAADFNQGAPSDTAYLDVLADALGDWRLQDNSASTTIANENGTDSALAGGDNTADISTTGPGGAFSAALDFDGSADYATQARLTTGAVTNLSCCAWIQAPTTGGTPVIISEVDTGGNSRQWQLALSSANALQLWVKPTGVATGGWRAAQSTPTLTPGQWYFVAATYDGTVGDGELALYIDGAAVAQSLIQSTVCNAIHNGSAPTRIAAVSNSGAAANPYDGAIAGAALWQRTLAASEVSDLFNAV